MHNFKELKLWQKSVSFSVEVYRLTASFPKDETFGLRAQVRNAAVSIASNIANAREETA
ncbi:MAG: four helix bundle protein [Ferruginibacter sp.]